MITGELKNKIDGLWDIFASGGLVNPLDVIEQITYLMFIHDLDDADNLRSKEAAMLGLTHESIFTGEVEIGGQKVDGQQLKWSVFHDFPAAQMYAVMQEKVFPFIKNLHGDKNSAYSKYMSDAIFKIPNPLVLSKVVDSLDGIYKLMSEAQASDIRGDTYEYLLSKISQSGLNGQFRTPRHIINLMVELMEPRADEIICDPACGTSGFLVAAGEYLKENRKEEVFFNKQNKTHYMNEMFHGYDMDRTMLRIGAMNMMIHGIDNPHIDYIDSLSDRNTDRGVYSLIFANPPFKGEVDPETVAGDLLKICKTKRAELLYLALCIKMLKVGGRCACIVPNSFLTGVSAAHMAIKKEIIDKNMLDAVISLPAGTFKPYTKTPTAILIFTKTDREETDNVWFYDMRAESDIPDLIKRFKSRNSYEEKNRWRVEKSFLVSHLEIVDNCYNLSINEYKESGYFDNGRGSSTEYNLKTLRRFYKDLGKALEELGGVLNE